MFSAVGAGLTTALPAGTTSLPTLGLMHEHMRTLPPVPRSLISIGERREQRSVTSKYQSLYCRSGYVLQVLPDGTVNGSRRHNTKYSVLEFVIQMVVLTTIPPLSSKDSLPFHVTIRGTESNRYVCMNSRGKVYGSKEATDECKFQQHFLGNRHYTYSSVKYESKKSKELWYLAIAKDGKVRRSTISKSNHKIMYFLKRSNTKSFPDWISRLAKPLPATPTPPATALSVPSWENCKKKKKRKCCRGLSRSDARKCRRKYGIKGKKGKRKNNRRRNRKSRTGKKNKRKHSKKKT